MHSHSTTIIADDNVINIMTLLKENTATAHKQLEKSSCFKRLFANDYSINEYAQLLSYFYGYYEAIEPILFNELPTEYYPNLQHRTKTHLLHQDLTSLNVNADALPVCEVIPSLITFAQKMGVLYVLEGSLLGGRVIGQHLTEHFDADALLPLNFYNGYGADLHLEWQKFSLFMGQCFNHQDKAITDEVIDSANATFATLQQWVESQRTDQLPSS
jgi:heme oxygenase